MSKKSENAEPENSQQEKEMNAQETEKENGSEVAEDSNSQEEAEPVVAELHVEPELTPEEALAAERDEFKEKWLRVVAELDNVRKRSRREIVDGRRFAQADVLRSFLDVQDNFERALKSMNEGDDEGNSKSLKEGVELIFQTFQRALKDKGVEPIEAMDQDFDPVVHEAVGQFEREGVEPGRVIEIVQSGFKMGDMVLRPSRVIISS